MFTTVEHTGKCTLYMHRTKKQYYISLKSYNYYYFINNAATYIRFVLILIKIIKTIMKNQNLKIKI